MTLEEAAKAVLDVAALRDAMDDANEAIAVQKDADADADASVAAGFDADLDGVRAAIDTQPIGATEVQKQEMRVKSRQADLRRDRAVKQRMNATRLRSLNHAIERANAKEIWVRCRIVVDDAGDIVGTNHYRIPVADRVGKDDQGIEITFEGLESRLLKGTAEINRDGKLVIDGEMVTP